MLSYSSAAFTAMYKEPETSLEVGSWHTCSQFKAYLGKTYGMYALNLLAILTRPYFL